MCPRMRTQEWGLGCALLAAFALRPGSVGLGAYMLLHSVM
jgi:hypothetical protein